MFILKLQGRVSIITGAARGIGRAIAEEFIKEGAKVVLVDIAETELAKAAEELGRYGEVTAIKADVSNVEEIRRVVEEVIRKYGRVDILVNNAGVFSTGPLEELTEEQWNRVMRINLTSAVMFSKEVVKYMKKQNFGKIINMASLAGQVGGIFAGIDYAVSKAGIICLTKALARRLARHNILVNAVAPGVIESPMTAPWPDEVKKGFIEKIPLGRLGRPEEVAKVVLFLASDDSNYITGQVINVDGGISIGP